MPDNSAQESSPKPNIWNKPITRRQLLWDKAPKAAAAVALAATGLSSAGCKIDLPIPNIAEAVTTKNPVFPEELLRKRVFPKTPAAKGRKTWNIQPRKGFEQAALDVYEGFDKDEEFYKLMLKHANQQGNAMPASGQEIYIPDENTAIGFLPNEQVILSKDDKPTIITNVDPNRNTANITYNDKTYEAKLGEPTQIGGRPAKLVAVLKPKENTPPRAVFELR